MRIEHAALYVRDLDRAREFFITYFGAASGDGYHNPRTDFRSYFLLFFLHFLIFHTVSLCIF